MRVVAMMIEIVCLAQLAFYPVGGFAIDRDVAALAAPHEMIFDCAAARFEGLRLPPDVVGSGGLTAAPMIEDAGQVMNASSQFAHPQEKVVILRTIKLRAKAPRPFQDLAPDGGEVAPRGGGMWVTSNAPSKSWPATR